MKNPTRFNWSSTAVLLIALGFIFCAVMYVVFAFQQPSDGWLYETRVDGQTIAQGLLMTGNSPLQPGDSLLAIDGIPIPAATGHPLPRPSNWQVGRTAQYSILRGGHNILLDVPLRMRGLGALLRFYQVNDSFPLTNLLWYLIGFGIFFIRPRDTAAWLLLLFTTYWNTIDTFIQVDNNPAAYFYPSGLFAMHILLNSLWLFMYALIIHFMLIFPVSKWPVTRHPKITLTMLYGVPTLSTILVLITDQVSIIEPVIFVMIFVVIATIIGATVHNLRTLKDPVTRAQVRWVVLGISAPIVAAVFAFGLESVFPSLSNRTFSWIWSIVSLLLPICFGIAITRYRLFDIDLIIRRTLLYTGLTATLGLLYFGSVVLLRQVLGSLTGNSTLAIVLSTLLIAALFEPVRRRIQSFVDRRFYRQKYNAALAIEEFSEAARREVELNRLTSQMVGVVEKTLQPVQVSVWLRTVRRKPPEGK